MQSIVAAIYHGSLRQNATLIVGEKQGEHLRRVFEHKRAHRATQHTMHQAIHPIVGIEVIATFVGLDILHHKRHFFILERHLNDGLRILAEVHGEALALFSYEKIKKIGSITLRHKRN